MGWQPIETAPRDDTLILLYAPIEHRYTHERDWTAWCDSWDEKWRWTGNAPEFESWSYLSAGPTHWMPLPEPPVTP